MSYLWRIIFYIFSDFWYYQWSFWQCSTGLFHTTRSSTVVSPVFVLIVICPLIGYIISLTFFKMIVCPCIYIYMACAYEWHLWWYLLIFYYLKKVCFFAMPLSFHSFSPEEVILLHFLFLKFQVEFISILSNLWLHMKNIMWQTIQRTWEDPVLYSFWKLMVRYVCGIITTLCSKFTWWLSAGWIRNGGGHNLPNVHPSSMFKY